MKRVLVISILMFALFSCENKAPSFTTKANGIYMKLLAFEEEGGLFKEDSYVKADVTIISDKQIIYRQYKEQVITPKHQLSFLFHYLSQGDSAVFMVDSLLLTEKFPQLQIHSEFVKINVKVNQYLTENINDIDKEMLEQVLLKKYLKENKFTEKDFKNGIYVKNLKKGLGEKIKNGNLITINYKGSFINELEFDKNFNQEPFTFNYGAPDQVIKGLEIAINGMRKGEKSKIIIPSQLAFGEEGSTTQIIPPYTTVVYKLEIINVK